MKNLSVGRYYSLFFIALLLAASFNALAQSPWKALEARVSTLGLEKGFIEFDTPDFHLKLVRASQTIAALNPVSEPGFDFTPNDRLQLRSKDGLFHLGDLNIRLRTGENSEWKGFSTATKRADVRSLSVNGKILAAADLASTLPSDIPLQISRFWETSNRGELQLRFVLNNKSAEIIELGALGIPMVFNNILQDKSLNETHSSNVFYDPYIGSDAGYLQVCRLKGNGPVLLVVPGINASFEAYNPLLSDPTPRGITFEGFHEWMVHSKAYGENEWKQARQWNESSSKKLQPGEVYTVSVKFILTNSVRAIEPKLIEQKRPVAVGVPGYVLPQDVNASLFLNYKSNIKSMEVFPQGSLSISKLKGGKSGWKRYNINGNTWGRSRLTITYKDGLRQTIHYKIIHPEDKLNEKFGQFLTKEQWYKDEKDPFKRNESVISYDYQTQKQVIQDNRVWISGLSDEGGAGGWLAAIMKQLVKPNKAEVSKLQRFVNHTLWGGLQYSDGERKYGVRKSMFYYEPEKMPAGTYSKDINWKIWSAWPLKEAESTGRSYNYPHVAAAHWVLYRLSRNHKDLVTEHAWDWYIKNAFHTTVAMMEQAPHYAQYGQMEGTVFLLILQDLKDEGYTDMATQMEGLMRKRADIWKSLNYPFGSEMPWDSTGQEEVYMWSDYFGYDDKAKATLDAILAYMPTVPHWGYNGSARRYWDFLYGGKLSRVERQLHHYGSGLNAIPVLNEYRKHPNDLYLLRVGYGGLMGSVSNVTEDGFGPAAFHSFPSTLEIDYLSGDYGSNYFGYAVNTATFIVKDNNFGWLCFGGNLSKDGKLINVKITTAAKSKVFIAPANLWIELEAGKIESLSYNRNTEEVLLNLTESNEFTPIAYLKISETGNRKYELPKNLERERGMVKIPLQNKKLVIKLSSNNR